jgi:hypothetical protein
MSEFMAWFGGIVWTFIDAIVTSLTLGLVLYNWYIVYRQSRPVQIVLNNNDTIHNLATVMRKHLTRAEVLGMLGQFQLDSTQRYNIKYLSTSQFYDSVINAQNDRSNQIVIHLDDKEFGYFVES